MNYRIKQLLKIIYKITPYSAVCFISGIIANMRYGLNFGRHCFIHPDCHFEGNNTILNNCHISGSSIGRSTYIGSYSNIGSAKIGRYTAIGENVKIQIGRHPVDTFVSIHPSFYSASTSKSIGQRCYSDGDLFDGHTYVDDCKHVVEIGSDVWVGNNVLIMDGVRVGHGAVIGAGSIVTRDVSPYEIVVGIPARTIRTRFSPAEIEFLLGLSWWNKSDKWIEGFAPYFSDIKLLMEAFKDDGPYNNSSS